MPRFTITRRIQTRDVQAIRAVCDGCDPARPCEEHAYGASLWLLTAGAFELRDGGGRHVLDPTRAFVMPGDHPFQIRHPAGPDVCIAFHGPIVEQLAERGARFVAVSPPQLAELTRAMADDDSLAVAEAVADLAEPEPARADRDLAAGIADVLRVDFAHDTSLDELAVRTGYSIFHSCRVFRATTGYTIHGFRRELRLRHALARILDSRESLSQVAAATGFASQSHLTNLFRARYGTTPAKARRSFTLA